MGCQTTRYRIESNSCPNRTWGRSQLGSGLGKNVWFLTEKERKVGEGYLSTSSGLHGSADSTLPADMILDVWRTRDVSRMITGKFFWKVSPYIFPRQCTSQCLKLFMNNYPFHHERGTNTNLSYPQGVAPRLSDFVRSMLHHWRKRTRERTGAHPEFTWDKRPAHCWVQQWRQLYANK